MKFKSKIEETDTIEIVNSKYINWDELKNSTILVTGATGLIGSQIVKALLYANEEKNTNIKILALVRSKNKAEKYFKETSQLKFIVQDVTEVMDFEKADYVIHTANGTASKNFVEQPVETINTIVSGTKNVLDYALKNKIKSFVYLSSMEVYGNIPLEREEPLKETDYGYIDTMKVRNSYPLGKRLAENLCVSYFSEYKVPVKIARLSQTIGANVDYNDNRVFMQFARNIIENKNIVLHTEGLSTRSFCYITDAVVAILSMLHKGRNGEVYNIANSSTTCSIKELAEMLCGKYKNSELEIQAKTNLLINSSRYYLGTTKYYLDTTKYYLDSKWIANVSLEEMFNRLIKNQRNNLKETTCNN